MSADLQAFKTEIPPRKTLSELVSIPELRTKFESKFERLSTDECWDWKGRLSSQGYANIWFQWYAYRASRVSLAFEKLPPDESRLACHHCDNRACVNPAHLYWGDYRSNTNDCVRRGRFKGHGKPSREDVVKIREMHASGMTLVTISSQFGVDASNVGLIVRRKTWTTTMVSE